MMEKKHAEILRGKFPEAMEGKRVVCLGIEDVYEFMDAELVEILEASMEEFLREEGTGDGSG